MKAAGDTLRANVIRVLAQDAFAVSELGRIFAMAQPAISHHLKLLSTAGIVDKRREGTSVYYQRASSAEQPLLAALFNALDEQPLAANVHREVTQVHQARLAHSRDFFANHEHALRQQTEHICAPQVYLDAIITKISSQPLQARRRALEIGPGDGTLLEQLADHYVHVVGIDNSTNMLAQARTQTQHLDNVRLIESDFDTVSTRHRYDLTVAAMAVHHLSSPRRFFERCAQLLSKEGLLVIAELCTHEQEWVKQACGDLWMGFDTEQLSTWATQAGLQPIDQQFLAQRNGFRVQVLTFSR